MTAVTYRKTSKSSMGELSAVSIEYSELCATVSRLSGLLGMTAGKTAWIRKIAPRTPELSVSEIDRIANQARTCMGLEPRWSDWKPDPQPGKAGHCGGSDEVHRWQR